MLSASFPAMATGIRPTRPNQAAIKPLIIDVHTHIFPLQVISGRAAYLAADATFAALYANPRARLATATNLIASMDAAGIDVSVALGFSWKDEATCRLHNDYLLDAAAKSGGRIVPFCTLPLAAGFRSVETEARRCTKAGARGFGELRPESLGFDLAGEDGRLLGGLARDLNVALLFHTSEPVGHDYPGKDGLGITSLYAFIRDHPAVRTIAAHWGGGLPFYALMPEVKLALNTARFDTAATSLLYYPAIYERIASSIGVESILFGSDFPLLSQARSRRRLAQAGFGQDDVNLILGENARRFLGLE
jgi:predicted TIM-barrel fold metal-dependent hydrolase